MARLELTSGWVTSRLGKPHPEQDQIEGQRDARPRPRVGRSILPVTEGLDRWSPSFRQRKDTELGLQVYLTHFYFYIVVLFDVFSLRQAPAIFVIRIRP